MKRGLFILALVLAAGITAFFGMRMHKMASRDGLLLDSMPELAWVRTELKVTDDQFTKVSELHAAYRAKCMEMCQRIAAAEKRMAEVAGKSRIMTPELEAAIRENAETHAQCRQAMVTHLYETAGVLNPDQASRYLEKMLPFALEAAPNQLHSD